MLHSFFSKLSHTSMTVSHNSFDLVWVVSYVSNIPPFTEMSKENFIHLCDNTDTFSWRFKIFNFDASSLEIKRSNPSTIFSMSGMSHSTEDIPLVIDSNTFSKTRHTVVVSNLNLHKSD